MGTTPASEQHAPASAKKNVRTIAALERAALHERTMADRISDAITRYAGSGIFVAAHVVWFAVWILANCGWIRGIAPFDPFPFTFLTMLVSLEAIFLSIFVLTSQNRITRQADRRAHLDLQINLLAEQEITTILRMLGKLCEKQGVEREGLVEEVQSLFEETDLHQLMKDLEKQLPE